MKAASTACAFAALRRSAAARGKRQWIGEDNDAIRT
jgi:hypothetical protein